MATFASPDHSLHATLLRRCSHCLESSRSVEALEWAHMVPNTRNCHHRQLEEEPDMATQIWYICNRNSDLGQKLKTLSALPDVQ
jgi:hypothetical protein|eukprot:686091-Prymnesium_polylepis.1